MTIAPSTLEAGLQRMRLRLHAGIAPTSVATGALVLLLVLALLPAQTGAGVLAVWAACVLAALGWRLWVWRAHVRATRTLAAGAGALRGMPAALAPDDARRWLLRYRQAFAAQGLAWALAAAVLPPLLDSGDLHLLVFALTTLAAAALIATSFDLPAAMLFVLPTMTPLSLHLLLRGGGPGWVLGALVALFVAVAGLSALRTQRLVRDGVRLRLRQDEHAQRLQHQAQAVEEARQALAEQHQLTTQLLHSTQQGFWFIDDQSVSTDANPAMCEMLGRPRDAVVGHSVYEFLSEADRLVLMRERAARQAGQRSTYELGITRDDGTRLLCMVQDTPLHDTAGRRIGSVGLWTDISARREAEAELRAYELAINSITDLVSVVDEHEVYRLVNDAWCHATGVSRGQALGCATLDILPSAGSSERRQALEDCLRTQQPRTVRGSGGVRGLVNRTLESTYYPYRDPLSKGSSVVLVTRDVTDQEASRSALAASAEYLRRTLEATGDAIFASDAFSPGEPVRFVNQQMLQMWGIPADRSERLTPAEIAAYARPLLVDALAEEALIDYVIEHNERHESQVLLRDGRLLLRRCEPAEVEGRAVRVWSFRDITAETRALQALRDSEAELRTLLEAFPGYIAAVDQDLRYRYVNERLLAVMGKTAEQMLGRTVHEMDAPSRLALIEADLARAQAGERVVSEREFAEARDGCPLHMELTLVAGPQQANGRRSYYSFGLDMTARKRAEAALITARDEAENANRAKTQFLSQMSHELRTPMNAILGFGQLLQSDTLQPLPPRYHEWVGQIMRGARHLMELVNEILDLGRIEAGQLLLKPEPVSAAALVDECLALMQPLAQRCGVQVLPGEPELAALHLMADRTRLKQVLLNLLGNAVKYNRRGGSVAVMGRCEADGSVWLAVRDTGRGLSAAECERLFEPFERLHAANTSVEGTGIGLALSRRLVLAMGGSIGVQSELGAGSTFWLRLPAAAQAVSAVPSPPAPETLAGAEPRTVLYIEDNPVNVALMEAMLQRIGGVRLLCALSGVDGLRLATQEEPALILLDIQLPGMDGFEVLRRLRKQTLTQRTPVVAVSANALPLDVDSALAAGFDGYLTKPLNLELLRSTVFGALAAHGPAPADAA